MALLLLCVAQFMLILDVAIVNVALPPIAEDLGFSSQSLQLVVTAYTLAFGGLLLLGGRLADVLGRRRMFGAGLTLFTVASLACGLAPTGQLLVAARAVQGVGGALVSPAALALLTTLFAEGAERNRALGVWSALAAAGGAAGLLLGGVLTDLAGWHWVFLVNVIGLPVAAAALRVLPEGGARGGRIDLPGASSVTAGLVALVYRLTRGGEVGFADPAVVGLLVGALVLLAGFVAVEARTAQPLLALGLFRSPSLTGANVATLLMSPVIIGVNFFLTLYLQQVLGFSPLQTGLAFLPLTAVSAAASIIAARLVARAGAHRLLLAGLLALAAGAALLTRLPADGSYLSDALPGLLLVAVGPGPSFTVGTIIATAGVPADRQGAASGVLSTSQLLGGAIGLAALSVVAGGSGAPGQVDGYRVAFLMMVAFALAGAAAAALLVRPAPSGGETAPARLRPTPVPATIGACTAPVSPPLSAPPRSLPTSSPPT